MNHSYSTAESFYFLYIAVMLFATAATWTAYSKISASKIEKIFTNNGQGIMCPLDSGLGIKAVFLACALGLPLGRLNSPRNPYINVLLAREYATRKDVLLSALHLVISRGFFGSIIPAAL